jgi:ENTS family enterobactin (siderophore) exporter
MQGAKRPHTGFLVVIVLALLFYIVVPRLPSLGIGDTYTSMVEGITKGNAWAYIQWALGDWADAQFHKTWLGGLFVILFAALAVELEKRRHPYCGYGACYGSGLFYSVLAAELIADAISVFLYARLMGGEAAGLGWFPTFVPVCSFAGGMVLIFGGGWKQILTAAIFGGLIGAPGSYWINKYLAVPFGMPVAIGNVGIMIIGSLVFHQVCDWLPWMHKGRMERKAATAAAAEAAAKAPAPQPAMQGDTAVFVRRIFADLTECCFFGSEWAGFGLVLGSLILAVLNAGTPAYGSNQLGAILCVQFLSAGLGLWLYWHKFKELGWIATFVAVVGVSPAMVLTFGTSLPSMALAALVGGIFSAPVAFWVSSRMPEWGHGYTGAVFSILITTLFGFFVGQFIPWSILPLYVAP